MVNLDRVRKHYLISILRIVYAVITASRKLAKLPESSPHFPMLESHLLLALRIDSRRSERHVRDNMDHTDLPAVSFQSRNLGENNLVSIIKALVQMPRALGV
jgi:hypothetical protein